jgi:hypothetical protein
MLSPEQKKICKALKADKKNSDLSEDQLKIKAIQTYKQMGEQYLKTKETTAWLY